MIKKVLSITILLLITIGFFAPSGILAADAFTVGLGDAQDFTVVPFDEYGNVITGTRVDYVWTLTPALGIIESVSATASKVTDTRWTAYNLAGSSRATVRANFNEASGIITATATYGGTTLTKTFEINTVCIADPRLYYGIASVKDSGAGNNNWQSSTAEILETCYPEYKLYDGIGFGENSK